MMNQNIEEKRIVEIMGTQNIVYVLENNEDFSLTQYKVLQNLQGKGFVKCVKSTYNGKVKLSFFSERYKPLSELIDYIKVKDVLTIFADMISNIIELKKNGFLDCRNIELSADKILIDPQELKPWLLYCPVENDMAGNGDFEKSLSKMIADMMMRIPDLPVRAVSNMCTGLLVDKKSLQEIRDYVLSKSINLDWCKAEEPKNMEEPGTVVLENIKGPVLTLKCLEHDVDCCFEIINEEFVIGKKKEVVDGYMNFNSAISRRHCKTICKSGNFYVVDLKSANGTFLNENRIEANKEYRLFDGDTLRLANSIFSVEIK